MLFSFSFRHRRCWVASLPTFPLLKEDIGSVKAQYLSQHIPTKDMASEIESGLEGQLKVLVAAVQDEEIRRAAIKLLKARTVRTKQN